MNREKLLEIKNLKQYFTLNNKKIVKAINHRPNYPDTKEYRAFVEKTQERLVFLSKKYANLAVEKEVEELNNVSAANKAIYN